jgi:hypothetical protein
MNNKLSKSDSFNFLIQGLSSDSSAFSLNIIQPILKSTLVSERLKEQVLQSFNMIDIKIMEDTPNQKMKSIIFNEEENFNPTYQKSHILPIASMKVVWERVLGGYDTQILYDTDVLKYSFHRLPDNKGSSEWALLLIFNNEHNGKLIEI